MDKILVINLSTNRIITSYTHANTHTHTHFFYFRVVTYYVIAI